MRPFKTSLSGGHSAERQWVESQRSRGLSVGHGKKLVVRHHNKNTDHVETPDAVGLFSIEIKERSLKFTSPEDYPYDTVIVDDLRGLSREPYKNLIYVYLSKPTGSWVWLCALDRDESWSEAVAFDRGRGHKVPCLYAPKSHLRPASQLTDYLYPHHYLELIDGNADLFVSGGGEAEERERYIAHTHPDLGGRARSHPGQDH